MINDKGLDLFYHIFASYSKVLTHKQITMIVLQTLIHSNDHCSQQFFGAFHETLAKQSRTVATYQRKE